MKEGLHCNNLQIDIIKRIDQLEEEYKKTVKRLENSPKGKLRIVDRKTNVQYYYRADCDKRGKYIPKNQEVIAKGLAQKSYDEKLMVVLKKEIQELKKLLKIYNNYSIENVYESMHKERQKLVVPIFENDKTYIDKWLKEEYEHMAFEDNSPEFYTLKGERVRSKSEVIIAEMLNKFKVPYRYEYPIYLKGFGTVHGDFYCLNRNTRDEIVWEHFGMMDNENYSNHAIQKIESYIKNDFIYGKNLIITFESSLHPINTKHIERIITNFLV